MSHDLHLIPRIPLPPFITSTHRLRGVDVVRQGGVEKLLSLGVRWRVVLQHLTATSSRGGIIALDTSGEDDNIAIAEGLQLCVVVVGGTSYKLLVRVPSFMLALPH